MSKFVGKLRIKEEAYTIGQLKEALDLYDDDAQICFVESTGVATPLEAIKFLDGDCEDIKTDGLFAPFDFELEDDVLYLPIYEGNIVAFMDAETERRNTNECKKLFNL